VEFANELQLNESLDKRSAIEMAARVRLRPILMTTAAMVTGLLPLLTATGAGAASRSRSGWWWSPACRSVPCSRCSCCRRSMSRSPPTTGRPPVRKRAREIADFDLGEKALKPTENEAGSSRRERPTGGRGLKRGSAVRYEMAGCFLPTVASC